MKKPVVLHPVLLAVFPAVFLFAHNIEQFDARMLLVPIVFTTGVSLLSWLLLSLVLSDPKRAGLIVSLFVLLFFSFGVCYLEIRALGAALPGQYAVGTPLQLLCVWAAIFALGAYAFVKTSRSLDNLTTVANVMAGCLLLFPLIRIGAYQVKARSASVDADACATALLRRGEPQEPDSLPDIYYIIVDGYARADVLEDLYQYDNTQFLNYLTARGFYVAGESRSNYCQTLLSLASSLNLMYLDGLVDQIGEQYQGAGPAIDMITDNSVFRYLKRYGYEIVAFASGYPGTELRNADAYLAARWYPDEFQTALMNMTPLPFVASGLYHMHDWHRERIVYTFDRIADVAELDVPVFVFAHILVPHPPFVFGRRGEEIDPEHQFVLADGSDLIGTRGFTRDEYVNGYRDQLTFTNARLQVALDSILSKSSRPTIVVLQADHGPGSMLDWQDRENTNLAERFSILNAYYLPDGDYTQLYEGITPVNTFRVAFNQYFGADYELLADESCFSTPSRPYAFVDVTGELDAAVGADGPE